MNTELFRRYHDAYENHLKTIALNLQDHILEQISEYPRIDRVTARAKEPRRFIQKAEKNNVEGIKKYTDPLNEIFDQVGARIVTYYLSDVEGIRKLIDKYFKFIESSEREPESDMQFGYFGYHYILFLPDEVIPDNINEKFCPKFFELQIKTLMQHAWSEAQHDLAYKPQASSLSKEQKRKFAFTSAQAWGADKIFDDLAKELDLPSVKQV
ncbi:MAG: hypothetical protein AAGD92_09000 [Pseudomonadota bacterium]